jgi:hypothetical protein
LFLILRSQKVLPRVDKTTPETVVVEKGSTFNSCVDGVARQLDGDRRRYVTGGSVQYKLWDNVEGVEAYFFFSVVSKE